MLLAKLLDLVDDFFAYRGKQAFRKKYIRYTVIVDNAAQRHGECSAVDNVYFLVCFEKILGKRVAIAVLYKQQFSAVAAGFILMGRSF